MKDVMAEARNDRAGKAPYAVPLLGRGHAGGRGAADDDRGRDHVRRCWARTRSRRSASSSGTRSFQEQFSSFSRPQLLIKAGPLILIAIGLSFGFKAGIWNIGAEGQYIIGAICGAAFGLAFYPSESPLIFPGMVIAGLIGGWAWAMIPGILKTRFRTNEILVSLLLVYVAEAILASAATNWLRNPEAMGFPGSRNLSRHPGTDNPEIIAGTGMHWGVLAAFIAVIAAYVLMNRHILGYQIRLAGQAPARGAFRRRDPNRLVLLCLGISGALAGAAGLFEVSGPAGQISIDFNVGYGFTAIIVAFLGRLHPIGILLAGLLMALTYIGGELAQLMLGIPAPRSRHSRGCSCSSCSRSTCCRTTASS
jgi:ABC-type uncharacterized transport system permease subunit